MTSLGMWHFGLTVANLNLSVDFYTEVLGMQVRHRQVQKNQYTSNMLGHEDVAIEVAQLVIPDAPVGDSGHHVELVEWNRPPGRRVGARDFPDVTTAHLALAVEDIDDILQRASEFSCAPISEVQTIAAGINRGGRIVFMRDPDGSIVELVEPPATPGAPDPS